MSKPKPAYHPAYHTGGGSYFPAVNLCPCGSILKYQSSLASPGYGHVYKCENGHTWIHVGRGIWYDPREEDGCPWELTEQDVI